MGLGKMKDSWPVWALVAAGIVVIALALSQNKVEKDSLTFHDIFQAEPAAAAPGAVGTASEAAADPVQSPAIVASPDHNQPTLSYAVQLYSFKDQVRADSMITRLKSEGIPAYAQISDLGTKGTWYRVRVGSYPSADEAKAMLAQLVKDHKDSIIVKDKK